MRYIQYLLKFKDEDMYGRVIPPQVFQILSLASPYVLPIFSAHSLPLWDWNKLEASG